MDSIRKVLNGDLQLSDIPVEFDEGSISRFAASFDGYAYWGTFETTGYIANSCLDRNLAEARTWLFFEWRRARHTCTELNSEVVRSIIARIAEILRDPKCRGADVATMQEKAFMFFAAAVTEWKSNIPATDGLSAPFLPFPSEKFSSSERRLVVVGRETNTWMGSWNDCREEETEPLVQKLTGAHVNWYAEGKDTVFFQGLDALANQFDPSNPQPRDHCLWANVVPFDQHGGMVSKEAGELIGACPPILPGLINITNPHAVVFVCGHGYDAILHHQFPDLRIVPEGKDGKMPSRLESSLLPAATFRTYHPAYLRRDEQWGILAEIARLTRQVPPGSN